MDTINFDKQLWQLYITAKKSILDKNAAEIKIEDYELDTDNKSLSFQLFYENPLLIARKAIDRYFNNVEIKESESLLQYSISKEYDENTIRGNLKAIKEKLEPLFFEVEINPKQQILFESANSVLRGLLQFNKNESVLSDTLLLTKSQIFETLLPKGFKIEEKVGAVVFVSISFDYYKEKILKWFSEIIQTNIEVTNWHTLKITNGYINEKCLELTRENSLYEIKLVEVKALFKEDDNFFKEEFQANETIDDPYLRLLVYLKTNAKEAKLIFYQSFYELHTKPEAILSNGLTENEWNQITQELTPLGFYIVPQKGIISFDFNTLNELEEKQNIIKKIPTISLNDRGDEHRFKIRMLNTLDSFSDLKKQIKEKFKWVNFRDRFGGEQAVVSMEYSLDESGENKLRKFIDFSYEQAQIHNALIKVLDDTKYVFQIKYNEEAARYAESQKLSLLKGADITWQGNLLGSIQKIGNKKLVIHLDKNLSQEFKEKLILKEHQIGSVKPELRGELDKLYRLQEVVQSIDNDKKTIVNPNLREFFFDSSKATPIDANYFELTNEKWLEVITLGQSKTLNFSQWRAVTSALYAQDIAMIQGPPGTGKSTVIAEIIWQHLIRNPKQRILLTSETHMAVDNAIERVVKNYNIVKPIRFGDDLKLENEGARFSLNRIKKWAGVFISKYDESGEILEEQDGNIEDNVLRIWFDNIRKRSQKHLVDDKSSPLSWWHEYLQNYPAELKMILYNNYVKNVNLLGATSSSIGWKNEEGKWTKFFKQWLELYPNDAKKSHENPLKFDITIIDEASKATPPELALPLLFSKKGIIVGDHRQLPPMLDGDEFEATLELNGELRLLQEFKKYDTSKSHFEKLFLNPQLSPTLKTTFDTQFRMHPAIGSVIQQFYKDDLRESGLKCGLDLMKIEQGFDEPQSRFHGLKSAGFIQPHQHCIWVNVESPEIKEGTSRINYGEVAAVKWVLESIQNSHGFDDYMSYFGKADKKQEDSEIGIISFYGKQLQALQAEIKNQPNLPIRISTVDRFQGMERNIVIVSLVRSNIIALDKLQEPDFECFGKLGYPNQPDLGFAKSHNRLNVALSRAKRLLIIVGNAAHFSQKEMYADVISQITNSQSGTLINFSSVDTYER